MEYPEHIPMLELAKNYTRTGVRRTAIFGARKPLMEELYNTGVPIYCDQSYYVHEQKADLVKKVGEHFQCDVYKTFENWRDCHYYSECIDKDGNKIWLMTGGRYD